MSTNPFLLAEGTRVIKTAGASGIGRSIADLLIAQKARVHICDIDETALAEFKKAHPAHGATKADVSKEANVETLFADAAKTLGGLDALINNAGIAGPTGKVEELSIIEWNQIGRAHV